MSMLFQMKPVPAVEGQRYFDIYADNGKQLASSAWFVRTTGKAMAAATNIRAGASTCKVKPDANGKWYFEIYSGPGPSLVLPAGELIATSERFEDEKLANDAWKTILRECAITGPGEPTIMP
jgi:hypothetical protein